MANRQILSMGRLIHPLSSPKKGHRLEFEYSRSIRASVATVWNSLVDPSAMEPHLPGTAKVVSTGQSSYRVSMKISMGFLRPTVNADVQLSGMTEHRSFTIELSGKSMGAGIAGKAKVALSSLADEEDSTKLKMIGTVETSGLLKKIPDSKIEAAASGFLDSYFASVEKTAAPL